MEYRELTDYELTSISGGGPIKDLARWCAETWCSVKETVSEAIEDFADGFNSGNC